MDWKNKLENLKNSLPLSDETPVTENETALKKSIQNEPLRIELDKRNGKPSTLIYEFVGTNEELKELSRILKVQCSTGGSCKDGEILLQGDFRHKVAEILLSQGYKIKRINFK